MRRLFALLILSVLPVVAPPAVAVAEDRPRAGLMWNRSGLPATFPLVVKTPAGDDYVLFVADPQDGRLDLLVVPAGPRLALAARAVRMRRGDLADAPDVVHTRVDAITLHVPAGTPFNVDGELVEAGPVVEVTLDEDFRLVSRPAPG